MNLRPVSVALLLSLIPAVAQEPVAGAVIERVEKFMAAQKASEVKASDQEYGTEVLETLTILLPSNPELALRYFLRAREQVDADRKAGTVTPGNARQSDDMQRSVSVLGAALGGALERVEKAMPNGDERLPGMIAAAVEMLASDRGCGVESCRSVCTHLGWMIHKAGRPAEKYGAFREKRLMEKLGPVLKPEWMPAALVAVRGVMWETGTRSDAEAQEWLARQATEGAHREFAMLQLATARLSAQERDASNKPRAGILLREELPEEQQWLLALVEQKNRPPAMMASAAAEILRDWPTAEPPLRYACAQALAAVWTADTPVNDDEAERVVKSLALLVTNNVPPRDESFTAAARLLAEGWLARMERGRKTLYGWSRTGCSTLGPALMKLAGQVNQADLAQKIFTVLKTEAAKDESLGQTMRLSESFQRSGCHTEALQVLDSITAEQLEGEKVTAEWRIHRDIKRVHLPIEMAAARGGLDAAVKATVTVLTERTDEPAAWTGAAWGWHNWGMELRAAGNHEGALQWFCIGCILAHAADKFARATHGKYQPPSENACREELKALKFNPDKISVFRTQEGVRMMLAEFGEAWKPLSEPALRRLVEGADVN
jgi:hypothetical protein